MPLNGTFPYQFKCSKFCLADLGVKVIEQACVKITSPKRHAVLETPLSNVEIISSKASLFMWML